MKIGKILLPLCAAVSFVGCSKTDKPSQTVRPSAPVSRSTAPVDHSAMNADRNNSDRGGGALTTSSHDYNATNTGRNMRDRDGATLTSGDQSESKGDLKITQNVRKALVADKELSLNAHNVKVITVNGTVTLRGPVDSEAEKSSVAAKAEKVAGTKVVDELEVKRR